MIEVSNKSITESELVWWEDELVGPSLKLLQHTIGTYGTLGGTGGAHTYAAYSVTLALGLINDLTSLGWNEHLLATHLVLGQVFHLDSIKVSKTAVQGDKGKVNTLNLHALHQLTAEVQTCGRSCNSTLVLGVDSLEILHILWSSRTLVDDVTWQWSLAKTEQHLFELVVRTVVEETQCTSAAGGVVDDLSHHWSVFFKEQLVSNTYFTCRLYKHVPQALVGIKLAQQEHLNLCICLFLGAIQSCREHLGIVKDKGIVLIKVVQNVTEVKSRFNLLTLTM